MRRSFGDTFSIMEKDLDGADAGDDDGETQVIVVGHWHLTWPMLLAVEMALAVYNLTANGRRIIDY